ncbi:hypothetical protein EDD29_3619 [Actinocorallia herbida]|uniref:Lipocalin-like protein n=1 Tax=Actinocorallia herbida TaxID=58109 RepID=A0A3N1CZ38_9ACTN|nr:hypothetical protein [Actinocorallia herbida]ROO86058.1 hypothetical protein EDD29_3619 [Actinocorallia herbida]
MTGVTGSWVHSFEEDTETTAVYRAAGHPFPVSRRLRRELEFRPDGTFVERGPGPDDWPRETRGRWASPEPGRVDVTFPDRPEAPTRITVVSVEPGVLTIAK